MRAFAVVQRAVKRIGSRVRRVDRDVSPEYRGDTCSRKECASVLTHVVRHPIGRELRHIRRLS